MTLISLIQLKAMCISIWQRLQHLHKIKRLSSSSSKSSPSITNTVEHPSYSSTSVPSSSRTELTVIVSPSSLATFLNEATTITSEVATPSPMEDNLHSHMS